MKLLYLTALNAVPTEEGQKRIEKAVKKNRNGDEDNAVHGSAQWYRNLGVAVPKDLEDDGEVDEIDMDGYMQLPIEEIEYQQTDLVLNLEDFSSCQDDAFIGSHLMTKSGELYHIEENADEVFGYITVITRPWHQRVSDWIKMKLRRNKVNINK